MQLRNEHKEERCILIAVRTLPEPAVDLLFDGIQEVFADNLGLVVVLVASSICVDALQNESQTRQKIYLFQFFLCPVGVGLLLLLITNICVNILLDVASTAVQLGEIVTEFALGTLFGWRLRESQQYLRAITSLEEGTKDGLGIFTKSELE